jgi:hypothetical protein
MHSHGARMHASRTIRARVVRLGDLQVAVAIGTPHRKGVLAFLEQPFVAPDDPGGSPPPRPLAGPYAARASRLARWRGSFEEQQQHHKRCSGRDAVR